MEKQNEQKKYIPGLHPPERSRVSPTSENLIFILRKSVHSRDVIIPNGPYDFTKTTERVLHTNEAMAEVAAHELVIHAYAFLQETDQLNLFFPSVNQVFIDLGLSFDDEKRYKEIVEKYGYSVPVIDHPDLQRKFGYKSTDAPLSP